MHCGKTRTNNINKMANSADKAASRYTILKEEDVPGAKLAKDPEKCIMEELRRWLECHGLKKSGKKDELVSRLKQALKLNLPVTPKINGGKWYDANENETADNLNSTTSTSKSSIVIY